MTTDNQPLTPSEIAAGLEACRKAARGPWTCTEPRYSDQDGHALPVQPIRAGNGDLLGHVRYPDWPEHRAYMAFVTLARDLLPRALRQLQDMQTKLDAATQALLLATTPPSPRGRL